MSQKTTSEQVYGVQVEAIGIDRITVRRLLCNDVTQSPSAPPPPNSLRALLVVRRNAETYGVSAPSLPLVRSPSKEDEACKMAGKRVYKAFWHKRANRSTGDGNVSFRTHFPTPLEEEESTRSSDNSSKRTTKSTSSGSTSASSRSQTFDIQLVLTNGKLKIPIATCPLTVEAVKGNDSKVLKLHLTNLETNDTSSSSAAVYGVDEDQSVLRVKLSVAAPTLMTGTSTPSDALAVLGVSPRDYVSPIDLAEEKKVEEDSKERHTFQYDNEPLNMASTMTVSQKVSPPHSVGDSFKPAMPVAPHSIGARGELLTIDGVTRSRYETYGFLKAAGIPRGSSLNQQDDSESIKKDIEQKMLAGLSNSFEEPGTDDEDTFYSYQTSGSISTLNTQMNGAEKFMHRLDVLMDRMPMFDFVCKPTEADFDERSTRHRRSDESTRTGRYSRRGRRSKMDVLDDISESGSESDGSMEYSASRRGDSTRYGSSYHGSERQSTRRHGGSTNGSRRHESASASDYGSSRRSYMSCLDPNNPGRQPEFVGIASPPASIRTTEIAGHKDDPPAPVLDPEITELGNSAFIAADTPPVSVAGMGENGDASRRQRQRSRSLSRASKVSESPNRVASGRDEDLGVRHRRSRSLTRPSSTRSSSASSRSKVEFCASTGEESIKVRMHANLQAKVAAPSPTSPALGRAVEMYCPSESSVGTTGSSKKKGVPKENHVKSRTQTLASVGTDKSQVGRPPRGRPPAVSPTPRAIKPKVDQTELVPCPSDEPNEQVAKLEHPSLTKSSTEHMEEMLPDITTFLDGPTGSFEACIPESIPLVVKEAPKETEKQPDHGPNMVGRFTPVVTKQAPQPKPTRVKELVAKEGVGTKKVKDLSKKPLEKMTVTKVKTSSSRVKESPMKRSVKQSKTEERTVSVTKTPSKPKRPVGRDSNTDKVSEPDRKTPVAATNKEETEPRPTTVQHLLTDKTKTPTGATRADSTSKIPTKDSPRSITEAPFDAVSGDHPGTKKQPVAPGGTSVYSGNSLLPKPTETSLALQNDVFMPFEACHTFETYLTSMFPSPNKGPDPTTKRDAQIGKAAKKSNKAAGTKKDDTVVHQSFEVNTDGLIVDDEDDVASIGNGTITTQQMRADIEQFKQILAARAQQERASHNEATTASTLSASKILEWLLIIDSPDDTNKSRPARKGALSFDDSDLPSTNPELHAASEAAWAKRTAEVGMLRKNG